ncbi:MAG: AAA family ATPase [bacterium]
MITGLVTTICQTCQGAGVQAGHGAAFTCPTCTGVGSWLQTGDGKRLQFDFSAVETSHASEALTAKHWIRLGIYAASFGFVFLSFILLIIEHGASLTEIFWSRGIAEAIFGIAGLASMWSITSIKAVQTSRLPLMQLEEDLQALPAGSTVSLNHYSNERIELLLRDAAAVAAELHTPLVNDTVFLITLLRQQRIRGMFSRMEKGYTELSDELKKTLPEATTNLISSATYAPEVRQRLFEGLGQALDHQFPYVEVEDVLLSYLARPEGFADIFKAFELTYDEFYAVSRWFAADQERARKWAFWLEKGRTRPKGFMNRAWTALPTPFLDQYSTDLTRLAGHGAVASVSVRDAEIQKMLEVLGRTQKNSLLMLGEPGVGKNTLLGALALHMIEEDVPEILKDKRLISMDSAALLDKGANSEQNMQAILDEVGQAGNVILAIPDIQVLVGTSDNALDAASLLSSALNQGKLQVITTATYADYHRYVESNAQLAAILETVEIKEVSVEQAITILEEEAPSIEAKQQVFLTYPAIATAAEMAKKYFPEKMLPESAIGLIDEAASAVRLAKGSWVSKDDVLDTVEKKTNIPVREADDQEATRLLNLEDSLHMRVIGQLEAIHAVANAIRRSRAGLHQGERPIATFLFVGPTGVGKTETAKALAAIYYGKEEAMIRLDMSEYQDSSSIYRLIGAPQASASEHTEGGSLTQPVRENPFSLILLDELEKASPEVLNVFLQLLDDGRLTENTGRTVHFNNTIIIATSNAGSTELAQLLQKGLSVDELPKQVRALLQSHFRPEFLNRFDAIVPFHPLTQSEIEQVVTLMLKEVTEKMAEQKYIIEFDPATVTKIAQTGFDPLYGARPLRRLIQDKVEGKLAEMILQRQIQPEVPLRITPEMVD